MAESADDSSSSNSAAENRFADATEVDVFNILTNINIEIYHACKWYLPKNTGWETGQISKPVLIWFKGKYSVEL